MVLSIYYIYVDSVVFIRKNILVVFPYFLYGVLNLISEKWISKDSATGQFLYIGGIALLFCLTDVVTVAFVYTREGLINSQDSIWRIVKRFYDKAVLLFLAFFSIDVLFEIILHLLNIRLSGLVGLIFPIFLFYGFFVLGLRHAIFYNEYLGTTSGIAGLKQLYNHFFFYLFVPLLGILVWSVPSLLSPMSWLAVPFLPIAELDILSTRSEFYWIGVLFNPILFSLIPIALTYAFIFKNKKDKNVS